jgi:hypothetical protein
MRRRLVLLRLLPRAGGATLQCTGQYAFTSLGLQMAFLPFEQIETISPTGTSAGGGGPSDLNLFDVLAIGGVLAVLAFPIVGLAETRLRSKK